MESYEEEQGELQAEEANTQELLGGTQRYESDVTLLQKALNNEKFSPEILPFQKELYERLSVAVQVEEKTLLEAQPRPESTLKNDLHWISLNRAKFLIRSYMRTRLWKIEEHVMHILMRENNLFDRLSDEEAEYATKYTTILDDHLQSTFLNRMPARFSSLVQQISSSDDLADDQEARSFDMVPRPDLDTHVFCRPVEHIGNFEVDGDSYALNSSNVYVMRYRSIQQLVESGQMELL